VKKCFILREQHLLNRRCSKINATRPYRNLPFCRLSTGRIATARLTVQQQFCSQKTALH